jgi:phosphoglycolate phosphatase
MGAFAELVGEAPDSAEVCALAAAYRARYAVMSLTDTLVAPGVPGVLEELGRSHTLAVATSKPRRFALPLLAALELERHFAYVAGPELDAHMEPKAVTVRAALARVGGPAVMVGDRSHDVAGARANGIPVIGVTWGIGDAAELADADALVDAPEDLPAAVADLLALRL